MTWRDKPELGLKEDQIRGPELATGLGRSPEIPLARGDRTEIPAATRVRRVPRQSRRTAGMRSGPAKRKV